MEEYNISYDNEDGRIDVKNFPDAAKFIKIDTPLAKRVADLILHRRDLFFAKECLKAINETDVVIIRKSLWFSAVAHYMKCFGDNKSRFSLQSDQILKGDGNGKAIFNIFKDLRDKHLIHDENSFMQSIPMAVLNKQNKSYKIEKIIASGFVSLTLTQDFFSNLMLLIDRTHEWVEREFHTLCDTLTKELEAMSYQELFNMPDAIYNPPNIEDIAKKR